jgi:hypothetical protein
MRKEINNDRQAINRNTRSGSNTESGEDDEGV